MILDAEEKYYLKTMITLNATYRNYVCVVIYVVKYVLVEHVNQGYLDALIFHTYSNDLHC